MTKRRLLKWALLGILVLVIVVVLVVWLALDSIVRRTVETQATASTNLQTRLDSARLSLLGGKLSLSGLGIASPKGFDAGEFFRLKKISVRVAYAKLKDQPIHIDRIVIDSPYLLVEQKGGQFNVKAAMAGMPPSGESSMRMIIDELQVKNTVLVLKPGLPMLKPEYSLTIPTVVLKNVGTGEGAQNGAAIKDVVALLLDGILAEAGNSGKLPVDLGSLKGNASQFLSADNLKAAATQRAADELRRQLDKNGEAVKKGLGDLLKK